MKPGLRLITWRTYAIVSRFSKLQIGERSSIWKSTLYNAFVFQNESGAALSNKSCRNEGFRMRNKQKVAYEIWFTHCYKISLAYF